MKFIYFFIFSLAVLLIVFFTGVQVGQGRVVKKMFEHEIKNQMQIFKIQENVNAETFNRGTDDIRNSLRKKYSIAD